MTPQPLTRAGFAPFGDVIETAGAEHFQINAGTMERFHELASVAVQAQEGDRAIISIARCLEPVTLPHRFDLVERHPLGSQAFIPLSSEAFLIVVGPPSEQIELEVLRAFVTNGKQGINYHRGVWHMPLTAFHKEQEFVIVDRAGKGVNCEEFRFNEPLTVLAIPE